MRLERRFRPARPCRTPAAGGVGAAARRTRTAHRRAGRRRSRSSPPPPTPISAARRRCARRLTPADAASRVLFYVDGRQVCETSARAVRMQLGSRRRRLPRTRCEWSPSSSAGGRVVRTVRTKALGYAEKVDVDVVQVIATVTDGTGHFVTGPAADGISRRGRRQAAEDLALRLRGRAARAHRRRAT